MPNARVDRNEVEDAELNNWQALKGILKQTLGEHLIIGVATAGARHPNNTVTNPKHITGKHSSKMTRTASHAKNGNTPL
jgi:hypothetical protein